MSFKACFDVFKFVINWNVGQYHSKDTWVENKNLHRLKTIKIENFFKPTEYSNFVVFLCILND